MNEGFIGEGIVVKNYDYQNKFGRQTWGKIVRSEFNSKHQKTTEVSEKGKSEVEKKIVSFFLTHAFIDKELAKVMNSNEEKEWQPVMREQLIGRVWHEFVSEEIWAILKKFKLPTIDFRKLSTLVARAVKEYKAELF